MQDIKLLRPNDVQLGREHKDICERLRSDLDKARKEYDRRFRAIQDHPVDYFRRWMVDILAEGNVEALGEYPYPHLYCATREVAMNAVSRLLLSAGSCSFCFRALRSPNRRVTSRGQESSFRLQKRLNRTCRPFPAAEGQLEKLMNSSSRRIHVRIRHAERLRITAIFKWTQHTGGAGTRLL